MFTKDAPINSEFLKINIPKFLVKNVYHDDDFIIDILEGRTGPIVRISIFEDGKFVDEEFIYKADHIN